MEIPYIPGEYGIMDHTVRVACVFVYKTHGDCKGSRNADAMCINSVSSLKVKLRSGT
jgi:hypothetical protein